MYPSLLGLIACGEGEMGGGTDGADVVFSLHDQLSSSSEGEVHSVRGQSCDSHMHAHLLYSQVFTRSGKGTKE